MRQFIFALVLLVAGPAFAQEVPTQLPRGVEPVSYDLTLTPDAAKLTFGGTVAVTFEAAAATDRIVLNAADLTIASAALDGAPAKVVMDADAQTATFTTGRPVSPGRHVLKIDYAGKIHDRPTGLFHVDYEGGRMLVTQFEPADARRLLPLFDEPSKKAVFTVTAVVPAAQTAITNMPETGSEPLAGGLKRVRFAPTPKMSSYLLFFGLGDMERISADVDGTTVSVLMRRGDAEKGRYALEAASELVRYYNDYFGVKYPLPKLDLVGAPGEAAGAMENWGAILFTQTYLTVDPKLSTAADKQTVYMVIAHEIAHMWFGDIVTMAWWDDLWLNEGFASWMASKATDRFHPEWKYLLTALSDKHQAMRLDARGSTHPVVQPVATVAQAEQAFDSITYMKGEAVIRMLESYAGADAWRDGVRAYIREHAYGNARSADLWRSIDKAAGKPVSAVAHDFTYQPGVPLISVSGSDKAVTLSQGRFGVDAASKAPLNWRTPVQVRRLGAEIATEVMVSGPAAQPAGVEGPLVANADQRGYFRTAYDEAALAPLAANLGRLPAADQFGLLGDTYALSMAGYRPAPDYLRLMSALPADADPLVWREQAAYVAGIDGLYDPGPRRDAYRAWAAATLRTALGRVSFDARPGEEDNDAVLRERLLLALSQLDDPQVVAEARRRYQAAGGELGGLPAGERRWVQLAVARAATPAEFDALLALAGRSKDPLERQRIWTDLAAVNDPALAARMLDLSISDQAPSNMGPRLVAEVSAGHPDLAWDFTLRNTAAITRSTDSLSRSTFVPRIASSSNDLRRVEELEAYAAKNIPADAQGEVRVAVSRIRTAAEIKAGRLPGIDAWIAERR